MDDDLSALVRNRPLGLAEDDIESILADLPLGDWCEDRDGWLQVGMALHHEYGGSTEGFEKWCAFSQQSGKFDAEDQERVWRSFQGNTGAPVRMATLLKAAKAARLEREYDFAAFAEDAATDEPGPHRSSVDELFEDLVGSSEDEPKAGNSAGLDDLIEPDPDAEDRAWRKELDLNEEGTIKNTASNLSLIIQFDPRITGCVQLNEFTQEVVTRKSVRSKIPAMVHLPVHDTINGDLWQDHHDRNVRMLLESARGKRKAGYGIRITDRDLTAAVDIAARKQAFHPVRDYLESLKWDGSPRVESLFIDYLGAPDTAYSREVARLTLLGAVVRAYEPGHKFDFVTILEGLQGKRKSTFISILARRWFAELNGDFHDRKILVEQMQGAWILEIPELSGFSKAEVQAIKGFVSATSDKVRLSYARRAAEFSRQCIFIGSTNEREYLKDHTGGRRFWPVECTIDEIDTDRLSREVDQVWAEALVSYRNLRAEQPRGNLPLYLADAEARSEASKMQESRRVETAEDAMAGEIDKWLDRLDIEAVLAAARPLARPPARHHTPLINHCH